MAAQNDALDSLLDFNFLRLVAMAGPDESHGGSKYAPIHSSESGPAASVLPCGWLETLGSSLA